MPGEQNPPQTTKSGGEESDGPGLDFLNELEGADGDPAGDNEEHSEEGAKPAGIETPSPVAATPPAQTPPASATPPAETQPKPGETPPAAAAAPSAATSAQPATPAATPAPASGAAPVEPTLDQVRETWNKFRGEAVEKLANEHYNIPPEQVKVLEDEGVSPTLIKALPRFAARVYMDAITHTMDQISRHLPQMISLVQRNEQANQLAEREFFGQWPQLNTAEGRELVGRLAPVYRQQNPKAGRAQWISEVGAAAMVALRLPITAPVAAPAPAPAAAGRVPATPVVPQGFRPSAASRPAAPAPTGQPKNIFEQMAEDDLRDNRGDNEEDVSNVR